VEERLSLFHSTSFSESPNVKQLLEIEHPPCVKFIGSLVNHSKHTRKITKTNLIYYDYDYKLRVNVRKNGL